ncbi:hypothetical protein A3715_18110 [Oleiphilus sp. HI0009]|nr:hypothetical protein A3715_18110 [Oleiphilus sp. HI0009]
MVYEMNNESTTNKVLFVDDEPKMGRIFQRRFDKWFEIEVYTSAKDLLNRLGEKASDVRVIVSDMRMPEMDGMELSIEIAKNYPHIKTIIQTGYADFENVVTAKNEGKISGYYSKPWLSQIDDIRSKISASIQQSNDSISFGK